MTTKYLSYLMGAENIKDEDLLSLGIVIEEKKPDRDRTLKIPVETLSQYIDLIKSQLNNGFWNEIVGAKEIIFIFKFKDSSIKEYNLSLKNEQEIDQLCREFNNQPIIETFNVYKSLSGNKFYHDFMIEHYADLINRKSNERS